MLITYCVDSVITDTVLMIFCVYCVITVHPQLSTGAGKLKMEDDLNFIVNGRRPQFVCELKTTSFFCNSQQPQFLLREDGQKKLQMEDDRNIFVHKI